MGQEHEDLLTRANRRLLEEIDHVRKRLALAERLAALLETVSGDWNEAHALLAEWTKLKP